jgi:hypothetical protein
MRQCFPSMLPIQLGILQMSNSYAFRSHSTEVRTAIYIGFSTFQVVWPESHTLPFIVFFPTRKEYPKDANDSPVARYMKQVFLFRLPEMWHNLRSDYMRERRKSKEKTSEGWLR